MKRTLKILAINLIILLILTMILNLAFLFSSFHIISQKKSFQRSYMGFLDNFYHKFYSDTYYDLNSNYIAIIGNSIIAGDGNSWVNNTYNYSSLHYLKEKTKKNFLNFGIAGSSSQLQIHNFFEDIEILKSFPFNISGKPEKILIFFTEQNDVSDNLLDNFIDKKYSIKRKIDIYFPLVPIIKNFSYKLTVKMYLFLKKSFFGELHKKQIQEFNDSLKPQSLININQKDISKTAFIFENSLNELKNRTNLEIEVFYVPGPVSILPLEFLKRYKIDNLTKIDNDTKSVYLEQVIEKVAKKNNIKFHSLTDDFKKISNPEKIYGSNDIQHFSEFGYKLMANFIFKKLNF